MSGSVTTNGCNDHLRSTAGDQSGTARCETQIVPDTSAAKTVPGGGKFRQSYCIANVERYGLEFYCISLFPPPLRPHGLDYSIV